MVGGPRAGMEGSRTLSVELDLFVAGQVFTALSYLPMSFSQPGRY